MNKTYIQKTDYLIIGAGIIGLTLAKQLKEMFSDKTIVILEKENDVAEHSSGRNSGVLHAGFYYTANSLKARFTREGNRVMKNYCKEKGLKINECKKVVVARDEKELKALYELEKRGKVNGVDVRIIDEKELEEIEPNAKTFQKALYSPTTATVDPIEICQALKKELLVSGVIFKFSEGYKKRLSNNSLRTQKGAVIEAGKIINCAGLYADKIAKDYGFCKDFTIIPFKGIYLKYTFEDKPVKTNIYPVPNILNPFLGVHYTVTVDGNIKIGPTSMPAFWRENYSGFKNLKIPELISVISYEAKLFFTNAFGFRALAFHEILKYWRRHFTGLASGLVKNINTKGFNKWEKPGIRAQLLNIKTLELVQDFIVQGDKKTIHILNAVSPAFTSSFPFTKWVIDTYLIE
ncbi:MAG: L-2-hydroxyglutarate oxidase [Elusimicrobia bacterium]|nr:L-2-hydroxyglutarate oxidase [Elusimicrobiota bacterium]